MTLERVTDLKWPRLQLLSARGPHKVVNNIINLNALIYNEIQFSWLYFKNYPSAFDIIKCSHLNLLNHFMTFNYFRTHPAPILNQLKSVHATFFGPMCAWTKARTN